VIFETSRFRVHTTAKSVWVELREPAGWVLREQRAIPLAAAWLSDASEASPLRDAIADFETERPGDKSLRAALTATAAPKPLTRHNAARVVVPKFAVRPSAPKKQASWRQPLRPPLKPSPEKLAP